MFRRAFLGASLAGLIVAAGSIAPAAAQEPLRVVASFSILGDMAREVGGDRIAVRLLIGPDGDAHVFQPTPADAKAVADADMLLVNGLGFEGWLDRLSRASGFKGRTIVASTGVKPLAMQNDGHGHAHGHAHGHSHGEKHRKGRAAEAPDPHAWQDPANGRLYIDNIAAGFAAADPAHAADYLKRAEAYKQRLAALDARLRAALGAIAPDRRRVITSHDAFRYFGAAYGIEFLAAAGVSTESEPSARQIAALIGQIRKEKVRALFVENMSNPRLVEQIGRDAGATVGGRLYSDALSPPGGPADTYERMFEHNAAMLIAGMSGN